MSNAIEAFFRGVVSGLTSESAHHNKSRDTVGDKIKILATSFFMTPEAILPKVGSLVDCAQMPPTFPPLPVMPRPPTPETPTHVERRTPTPSSKESEHERTSPSKASKKSKHSHQKKHDGHKHKKNDYVSKGENNGFECTVL